MVLVDEIAYNIEMATVARIKQWSEILIINFIHPVRNLLALNFLVLLFTLDFCTSMKGFSNPLYKKLNDVEVPLICELVQHCVTL